MVTVRLPDGKEVQHPKGVTAKEIVDAIGPGLARAAIAAKVDGEIVDLDRPLADGSHEFRVLTGKADDADSLFVMRHSCAHVMAEAICALWPQTKLVYGPPVDNGFYYDIDLDYSLTPDDFKAIEDKMAQIVKDDRRFTRTELPREEAMSRLRDEGNPYKIDNAERADGDRLSFYYNGEADSGCFNDLCRGPHVPSAGRVGAFKIMRVAGSYWHGDSSKQVLQRVYGTCWPDRKSLKKYLNQLEEAKKRDHRKIGPELGLFVLDPLVGPGLVLWKPRGAIIRYTLETMIREELMQRGYQPVYTPQIGRLELYRTSGHFPYYKESQFPPMYDSDAARILNELWIANSQQSESADFGAIEERLLDELERAAPEMFARLSKDESVTLDGESTFSAGLYTPGHAQHNMQVIRQLLKEEDGYLLRPMNCPHHIRIFGSERRSYKELPIRLAEFGTVYRYEQSGEINGLLRVRGMTQDDAHIFCTHEQLQDEIAECVDFAQKVLKMVGLNEYRVRVGLRDDSDKYVGSEENWRVAESAIRQAVKSAGIPATEERGEAAFYGPKVDFVVKDCIGREWQLGTVQVDYNLPERFDLAYIGDDNKEHRPVMVHRAPIGTMERFIGVLIEHFAGAFPLWLAPIQVCICTVSDKSRDYAKQVYHQLRRGLRVELDDNDDRIGGKIRRASMMKIPYILVVGEQEIKDNTVNVRTREGKQLGSIGLGDFAAACAREVVERSHSSSSADE